MSGKFEQWVQDTYNTDIKGYELSKHVRLRDVTRWANQYAEGIEANLSIDKDACIEDLEDQVDSWKKEYNQLGALLDETQSQLAAATSTKEA